MAGVGMIAAALGFLATGLVIDRDRHPAAVSALLAVGLVLVVAVCWIGWPGWDA